MPYVLVLVYISCSLVNNYGISVSQMTTDMCHLNITGL